jgi:uncharacterized RDD family membrane protein YckC
MSPRRVFVEPWVDNSYQTESRMKYAGVAHRFVAVLIDGAVFVALALVIAFITGGAYSNTSNGTHEFGVAGSNRATVVALLLFFAYYVICEAFFGRTIGKRVVGLRVVDENGGPIGLGASFVRNLLRIADGLFFYLVGAVAAWSSPRRQRLGDRVADTFVVCDRGGHPNWVSRDWAGTYTRDDFIADVDRANHLSSSR